MAPTGFNEGRVAEREWIDELKKEERQIKSDMPVEENIIIQSIKKLGSLQNLTPAEVEVYIINGKLKATVSQISDLMILIVRKMMEALSILRNDQTHFKRIYDSLPYSEEKRIGQQKALLHLHNDLNKITKRLIEYGEYWEENKKSNKISKGLSIGFIRSQNEGFRKTKILVMLLKTLHDDEKINKKMLTILADVHQKGNHMWN